MKNWLKIDWKAADLEFETYESIGKIRVRR